MKVNVTRKTPLYFAWKKAVNTLYGKFHGHIEKELKKDFGCVTAKVRIGSVDLEFESEEHITMFLLKWL